MTPPVFVSSPDDLASAVVGGRVRLGGDEGHHAVTVRRLALGEPIWLVDTRGRRVRGRVQSIAGKRELDVEVVEVVDTPPPVLRLTAVQALAKGDRSELAVELLTEIGVDEIVPWAAERSVVQWRGDRAEKSARRWVDAAAAAAKQARRSRFPLVSALAGSAEVAARLAAADLGVILHESAASPISGLQLPAGGELVIVIGPEGGITDDELAEFTAAGGRPVHLGPTVLRTSSAGIAAAAVLLAATDRWSSGSVGG